MTAGSSAGGGRAPEGAPLLSTSRFLLLLAAGLAASMSYGVTLPLLPVMLQELGPRVLVARHTGWLTAVYTFALVALSPAWGALSDRIDRRWVIAAGLAGAALLGGPVAPYFALCSAVMVGVQLVGYPLLERWLGEHRLVSTALGFMGPAVALLAWREPWAPAVSFLLAATALGVLIPALAVRISLAAGPRQGWAMGRQAGAANLGQAAGAALTGVLFSAANPAPFLLAGVLLLLAAVLAGTTRTPVSAGRPAPSRA